LRFDFGGCGQSADRPIELRGQIEDLKAAIAFMKSEGYEKLGLLGYSMGGLTC
jgi:alpha/beta superfamily hydrolase